MRVSRGQAVSVVLTLCNTAEQMDSRHVNMELSTVQCCNIGSRNIHTEVFVISGLPRNDQKETGTISPCYPFMVFLPPQDVCSGFHTIV